MFDVFKNVLTTAGLLFGMLGMWMAYNGFPVWLFAIPLIIAIALRE